MITIDLYRFYQRLIHDGEYLKIVASDGIAGLNGVLNAAIEQARTNPDEYSRNSHVVKANDILASAITLFPNLVSSVEVFIDRSGLLFLKNNPNIRIKMTLNRLKQYHALVAALGMEKPSLFILPLPYGEFMRGYDLGAEDVPYRSVSLAPTELFPYRRGKGVLLALVLHRSRMPLTIPLSAVEAIKLSSVTKRTPQVAVDYSEKKPRRILVYPDSPFLHYLWFRGFKPIYDMKPTGERVVSDFLVPRQADPFLRRGLVVFPQEAPEQTILFECEDIPELSTQALVEKIQRKEIPSKQFVGENAIMERLLEIPVYTIR